MPKLCGMHYGTIADPIICMDCAKMVLSGFAYLPEGYECKEAKKIVKGVWTQHYCKYFEKDQS